MNKTIQTLLEGHEKNHMMPFFWQHGEDEATLRKMMAAIDGANCGAVCVESRPHPDFCGPKWWEDMDVILDEARKRNMKVWILDDSHFPTGFANGAVLEAPPELCRKNIFCNTAVIDDTADTSEYNLRELGLLDAPKPEGLSPMEAAFISKPPARVFDDDRIVSAVAISESKEEIDLLEYIDGERLHWQKPQGSFTIRVVTESGNSGYHRDYINMLDPDSCRLLIDAVYEPHFEHYADDFGKTIVGFFSDEPELGNGFLYNKGNVLGSRQDLPWCRELSDTLEKSLGQNWRNQLYRLWQQDESNETAKVHYVYMDAVTKLVRENFSQQIGEWCREHGVKYIGHVIEDDGQHCRTGSSLGHYFRSLRGQDMAGIDDIGGQVLPQGEDQPTVNHMRQPRNGEFYHYGLAKLAQSAAAIEPEKNGDAMCEIFGNYGWQEGVRLEKYLADHFLVRGINYFVPHAFSGKDFPDSDCPPHFYAHGHNPLYRHFGELVTYMNRIATLTESGKHSVSVAVLYHGESEWCDANAMPFEKPLRTLYDNNIDCHVLPADIFSEAEQYGTSLQNPLKVNDRIYQAFIVPSCSRIPASAANGLARLVESGLPVLFVDRKPCGTCEGKEGLPEALENCQTVSLSHLAETVRNLGIAAPTLVPASDRIRILRIDGDTTMYLFVNEAAETYLGEIFLPQENGNCFIYDGWFNHCEPADAISENNGIRLSVTIEPLKSKVVVFGDCTAPLYHAPKIAEEIKLTGWKRSVCEGAEYPNFSGETAVSIPDDLAQEQPEFSGFVRYETEFSLEKATTLRLVIEDAAEGVEVFLNGESSGIQIAAPYCYDLEGKDGINSLVIEVATTLERQCYPLLEGYRKMLASPPVCGSGLTGEVKLYIAKQD